MARNEVFKLHNRAMEIIVPLTFRSSYAANPDVCVLVAAMYIHSVSVLLIR